MDTLYRANELSNLWSQWTMWKKYCLPLHCPDLSEPAHSLKRFWAPKMWFCIQQEQTCLYSTHWHQPFSSIVHKLADVHHTPHPHLCWCQDLQQLGLQGQHWQKSTQPPNYNSPYCWVFSNLEFLGFFRESDYFFIILRDCSLPAGVVLSNLPSGNSVQTSC